MSFLAPLFAAGLAALSLPILFHLIRRSPKGRRTFSSLRFLQPSPPRLTRRSRLDQILLLLLRCAVLALIALAFARPFWRSRDAVESVRGRRIAILVDTSASMRRPGIADAVRDRVEEFLDTVDEGDQVALATFDDQVRWIAPFPEERESSNGVPAARSALRELDFSWRTGDLGQALVHAADHVLEAAAGGDDGVGAVGQLVLVSDLQRGSPLDALRAFRWPAEVRLEVLGVSARPAGNAHALVLPRGAEERRDSLRVRVTNEPDSTREQLSLQWNGARELSQLLVHVPAGESRIVRVPVPAEGALSGAVALEGDSHPFDNRHYVAARDPSPPRVVYVGREADTSEQGTRFFLELALPSDQGVPARLETVTPAESLELLADQNDPVDLVVLDGELAADHVPSLDDYLEGGGRVVFVVRQPIEEDGAAAAWLPDIVRVREAAVEQYALWTEIDFEHPLFLPMADPRYSDFTSIHFWAYRQIELAPESQAHVVVRFDTGAPALIEWTRGRGRLSVLASGWHAGDSELARSSKFFPLLYGWLDLKESRRAPHYTVGDSVPVPAAFLGEASRVNAPDGTTHTVSAEATLFFETQEPGLYAWESDRGGRHTFAVNLAASEGRTAPIDTVELEAQGVPLGRHLSQLEETRVRRRALDERIEGQQAWWRFLVAAALAVLVVETLVAGRLAGSVLPESTAPASPTA